MKKNIRLGTRAAAATLVVAASASFTSAATRALPVTYFDFLGQNNQPVVGYSVHPDFNLVARVVPTPGLIQSLLVGSPTLLSTGPVATPQLTTFANLLQWYTPTGGRNVELDGLTLDADVINLHQVQFNYPSDFFPIDGVPGNLGNFRSTGHDFHFTMKYSNTFEYNAALPNLFDFAADDDLFVFVNDKLWVDLGGIHPASAIPITKDLNADAAALGLVDGGTYSYRLFFAERHTTQSALIATIPYPVPEAKALVPVAALGGLAGLMAWRRRETRKV